MNNYQRLEINLLPPEMAPSPAVRGSVVFSWIIAIAALVLIAGHFFLSYKKIADLESQSKAQDSQIQAAQPFENEYVALKEINDHTEGRGKLVGMATANYVEYPVVMDRVARILPDGVYLVKAGSSGSSNSSSELDLEFRTAVNDPSLAPRTLEAFKTASMFSECYLRSEDFAQQPIDEVKKTLGINYGYDGPGLSGGESAQTLPGYDFEIRAFVNHPVDAEDLPVVMDHSELMTQFTLASDPNAPAEKAAAPADATAAPAAAPAPAPAAPAGGGK